jgi:hypothetical protein
MPATRKKTVAAEAGMRRRDETLLMVTLLKAARGNGQRSPAIMNASPTDQLVLAHPFKKLACLGQNVSDELGD